MRPMRASLTTIAVVLLSLGAEASPLSALSDWWFGRSWEFIRAVGGIKAGETTRLEDGGVLIALDCDVSGSKTITHQPDALNSGIGVGSVLTEVEGQTLFISIKTRVGVSSACPSARFEPLDAGEYQIVYRGSDREPHEIGRIKVP
jgi:hypothetical protein